MSDKKNLEGVGGKEEESLSNIKEVIVIAVDFNLPIHQCRNQYRTGESQVR